MSEFRVIALDETLADEVRRTRKSPGYGHPVHAEAAADPWPCRVCLERRPEPLGEERLLFTYDAFRGVEALPLPGPVYVHAEPCRPHPADAGFPADLRRVPLTFNAYGRGRELHAQEYVEDGAVEPVIAALLARPEVDYLHVRHTRAGCYLCRIERAERQAGASESDANVRSRVAAVCGSSLPSSEAARNSRFSGHAAKVRL